ncbi:MAG TPA: hypothetical protein VNF51_00875 [Candidatus Paceibacterota bacterium]|nr:hypothetical protein [Candidatus Paceibacterota bacterium]
MEKKQSKSRRLCFTVPNYSQEDLERFHKLAESLEKHRYICYGLEIAETGLPHIQGYIEFNTAQRYAYLQKYFNFKKEDGELLKFHVETANGTAEENKTYTKKEGTFYEFGEPLKQGTRTDLSEIKEAVKTAPKDLPKIIDELAQNNQQLKFAENLQRYYFSHRDPATPPKVYWIHGQTGIGKTSLVYRSFDDICSVSDSNWIGTGYSQNECLLFDDFREGNVSFEQLLKITDRYPYNLFFKGGSIPLNSPFIIFTSPQSIDNSFLWSRKNENLAQLRRRVIEIDLDLVVDISAIDLRNYPTRA